MKEKTHGFGRKIDSDQCGNVCRRKRVACDKKGTSAFGVAARKGGVG
jgi:hypothetical protein